MSAIFLHVYPSDMQKLGLMCAVFGAIVMSVDLSLPEFMIRNKNRQNQIFEDDFIKIDDVDESSSEKNQE